ncbi:hypothetical protein CFAM422_005335 [Trichoderma lentiforme]|uniref:Uncharacterized protein n=1 Tax=Trichoderma lentiforme TaxID=1567552 RepID=A0A9P4XHI3_9HYPO|nr:hypothetical protein CFAM422_005335 [Trichoderma lentiforme]
MITRPDARRSNGVGLSATSGSSSFSVGDIIGLRNNARVWQLIRDPPCPKLGTTTVLCVPLRVRKKDLSDVSKHASTGPSNILGYIYALQYAPRRVASTVRSMERGVQYIPYACVIPPRNRQATGFNDKLRPAISGQGPSASPVFAGSLSGNRALDTE